MIVIRILILSFMAVAALGLQEKAVAQDRCGEGAYRPVVEIREVKDSSSHVITGGEILNYAPSAFNVSAYVSQPFKCQVDDIQVRLFLPGSVSPSLTKSSKAGQAYPISQDVYAARLEYPGPPGKMNVRVDVNFKDRFSGDHTGWGSPPFFFSVDLNPLTLSINSPTEGTVVKAGTEGFRIEVNATDDVGIKNFTIKVDGVVTDTMNAREDTLTLRQWLRAKVYGSGRRIITIIAKDKVDRTAERTFTVYSDDAPPTFSNIWPQTSPLDNPNAVVYTATQPMVAIRADIIDSGMAGVKEARLLDDRGRLLITRTRPYEGSRYVFDYTPLAGQRSLVCYIQAIDKVGNSSNSNMINIVWEDKQGKPQIKNRLFSQKK